MVIVMDNRKADRPSVRRSKTDYTTVTASTVASGNSGDEEESGDGVLPRHRGGQRGGQRGGKSRTSRAASASASATDYYGASAHDDDGVDAGGGENDLLVKAIANEMVAALMRENATQKGKNKKDLSTDVTAVAGIMASVNKSFAQNPERFLRDMLRNGLTMDGNEDDDDEEDDYNEDEDDYDHNDNDLQSYGKASRTSNAARSRATTRSGSSTGDESEGCFSELSMNTGGRDPDAPVDIWHPDFWGGGADEGADATKKGSSTKSKENLDKKSSSRRKADVKLGEDFSTGRGLGGERGADTTSAYNQSKSAAGSSGGYLSSSDGAETAKTGKTMHEFVKVFNSTPTAPMSDSDTASEVSDISDITGLTGIFEDYPEGRRDSTKSDNHTVHNSLLTGNSSSKKSSNKNRAVTYSVSFADVNVRQYERIMTDNPACTTGPSVGIGWKFVEDKPVKIDDFELSRSGRRPRTGSQLMLNRPMREKIIRGLGYTDREIAAVVRELNKLRYHRRQTTNNLGAQKMEEAIETAGRQVKKILFLAPRNKDKIMVQ